MIHTVKQQGYLDNVHSSKVMYTYERNFICRYRLSIYFFQAMFRSTTVNVVMLV